MISTGRGGRWYRSSWTRSPGSCSSRTISPQSANSGPSVAGVGSALSYTTTHMFDAGAVGVAEAGSSPGVVAGAVGSEPKPGPRGDVSGSSPFVSVQAPPTTATTAAAAASGTSSPR